MLYSAAKNFVFVHVWKTAGESVVDCLRPFSEFPFNNRIATKILRKAPLGVAKSLGWKAHLVHDQHLQGADIRDVMPAGLFESTYSFGFVRNPWDWTVSAFHYAQQTPANPEHKLALSFKSLNEYVAYREENHLRQQSSFLFDGDKQLVTRIGRFENLQEDFNGILSDLGIDGELPKRNASKRSRDWRKYYDDETYDRVAKLYARDIERLGYAP
jgi:hypothetical protein